MQVLTGCCDNTKSPALDKRKNYRVGAYYCYRGEGNMAVKNSGRIFMLLEEIKSLK